MQNKTATIEFIQPNNPIFTKVKITQNGSTSCTWYPSKLANKVQSVINNINKSNVTITKINVNKTKINYTNVPNQEILNLISTTTVIENTNYSITIYVDNRPLSANKSELILGVSC